VKSVEYLASGKVESIEELERAILENPKFKKFNNSPELDRNWNWRDKDFTYSYTRNKDQPGYIGSYCMDALSMALFLALHTNSYYEAVLWAANMGGDSDTVGAITGQICGAMYGISKEMLNLYSDMPDCSTKRLHLFIVALKLARHESLGKK
jgi:ADP-ribosylglycohydrolase